MDPTSQERDLFLHDCSSHIDLLLLDDDDDTVISPTNTDHLFVSLKNRKTRGLDSNMMDVLEAYRRCTEWDNPDILYSDDEYDDDDSEEESLVNWTPFRKLCGSRHIRADTVRHVFKSSESLMECDNVQVECHSFGKDPCTEMSVKRYDMWSLLKNTVRSDTVVVAVEATAICLHDVMVRQGMLNEDVPLPFVPGSNFVGIVHCCGSDVEEEFDLVEGCRVASLAKWGGNARYVSVEAHELIPIPKRVDSSEAAAVISTYLPAFQALQHGKIKASRYSPTSLANKNVLITDGTSAEGQAAIRLAFWMGASDVYATGKQKHHERLSVLGATPLDNDPHVWLPEVEGKMEVVLDMEFPNYLSSVRAAMKRKGRLVCYARPSFCENKEPGYSWIREIQQFWEQSSLSMTKRCSIYDPIFSFESYPEQFQRDLKFLFALLVQRQIRPKIDRYITLSGVVDAHLDLQTRRVDGSIICEPWKDESVGVV